MRNHKKRHDTASPTVRSRRAFTLVELLVVITIIGILASLITVAVNSARRAARRAVIALEMNQINLALEKYKNEFGEYPPLLYGDDAALVRHVRKRWPRYTLYSDTGNNVTEALAIRMAISNAYAGNYINNANLLDEVTTIGSLTFWLGGFPNQDGQFRGFAADPTAPFGTMTYSGNTVTNNGRNASDSLTTVTAGHRIAEDSFDKKTFITLEMDKTVFVAEAVDNSVTYRFPCIMNTLGSVRVPYAYFPPSYGGGQDAYLYTSGGTKHVRSYSFGKFTNDGWNGIGQATPYAKSGDPFASSNASNIIWYGPDTYQLVHPGLDGVFGNVSDAGTQTINSVTYQYDYFRSANTDATHNNISKDDHDNMTNFAGGDELKSLIY